MALKNINMGFSVVYHEEREMAHNFLWGQTGVDAVMWMQHLRTKGAILESDDATFIGFFQDDAKAQKQLSDARSWARVVAIAGPQVAPIILQGLESDKPAIQTNVAIACTKVQVNEAILTALEKLVEGKDKSSRDPR